MKLTETKLRRMIHEAVRKVLKEDNNKGRKEVFIIHIFNETIEDSPFDPIANQIYYDVDEAIAMAEEAMKQYADEEDTIVIYVMAGEYETPSGDIYGNPEAIYSISNKD